MKNVSKYKPVPCKGMSSQGVGMQKKAEGLFEGREVLADLICLLISSLSRVSGPD